MCQINMIKFARRSTPSSASVGYFDTFGQSSSWEVYVAVSPLARTYTMKRELGWFRSTNVRIGPGSWLFWTFGVTFEFLDPIYFSAEAKVISSKLILQEFEGLRVLGYVHVSGGNGNFFAINKAWSRAVGVLWKDMDYCRTIIRTTLERLLLCCHCPLINPKSADNFLPPPKLQ